MIEKGYKAFEEIPEKRKANKVAKETTNIKLMIAYTVIFFQSLLSNTAAI